VIRGKGGGVLGGMSWWVVEHLGDIALGILLCGGGSMRVGD